MMEENTYKELYWKRPEITSYPNHANVLALINQFENGEIWFWNHFLQLQINGGSYETMHLDFCVGDINNMLFNCPFIDYDMVEAAAFTEDLDGLYDKIISYINQGVYVYIPVDWYYIPAYEKYASTHNAHDILVLGYENDEFIVADFFKHFIYQKQRCKVKDFIKACQYGRQIHRILNKVFLIKTEDKEYSFDIHIVRKLLGDYLRGSNSNYCFLPIKYYRDFLNDDIFLFGINAYDKLIGYLKEYEGQILARPYYILYNHKIVICNVVNYLVQNGYLSYGEHLIQNAYKLRKRAEFLKNMILKYNVSGKEKALEKCILTLQEIRESEKVLIGEILERMKDTPSLEWNITDRKIPNAACFSGIDRVTGGTWVNRYGSIGYDVFKERCMPSEINLLYYNFIYKEWNLSPEESNQLAVVLKKEEKKVEVCRFFAKNAYIDIIVQSECMLSLYIYAHYTYERDFLIMAEDGDSGIELCRYRVKASNEGLYVNFIISGHVRVKFENNRVEGGVISGVFFSECDKKW